MFPQENVLGDFMETIPDSSDCASFFTDTADHRFMSEPSELDMIKLSLVIQSWRFNMNTIQLSMTSCQACGKKNKK